MPEIVTREDIENHLKLRNDFDLELFVYQGGLHFCTSARHRQISTLVATLVTAILVVSDGTLWVVDYDESGKRSPPNLVDEATLFVGLEYLTPRPETYKISHLQIFTRKGFTVFVDGLRVPDHPSWAQIFPRQMFV